MSQSLSTNPLVNGPNIRLRGAPVKRGGTALARTGGGRHLTGEDVAILARRDAAVVHNPLSNLKLGSGIAPLTRGATEPGRLTR